MISKKEERTNIMKEVLGLACSDDRNPSSYALIWEDKVLEKLPTKEEYIYLMSVLQLFSFGRPYYKEYVKPEALVLCSKYSEFLELLDTYKLEDIFSCYGVFAVNLSKSMLLNGVQCELEGYENKYCFEWGYKRCLQIVNKWMEVFNDPIKVLVNYKYALNIYERNTSMKLKRREREYREVYEVWGDRYCSTSLQERLKTIKINQFTTLKRTML